MHFISIMTFAQQLQMNFPEAVSPEDFTSKLTVTEPSFSVLL